MSNFYFELFVVFGVKGFLVVGLLVWMFLLMIGLGIVIMFF